MDPFTIAALGLGVGGSLYGAISNAATASDRKKKFLEEQQRLAQRTAMRNSRMTNFFDRSYNPIDAKYREDEVNRAAEENFDVGPADFLPVVTGGLQLAGGLYDAGLSTPDPSTLPDAKGFNLKDPSALEYYNPEELGRDAKAPWEELEYYDPRQQTPWWRR